MDAPTDKPLQEAAKAFTIVGPANTHYGSGDNREELEFYAQQLRERRQLECHVVSTIEAGR